MTGIEAIEIERYEQVNKHGRTVQYDVLTNDEYQLIMAAGQLILPAEFAEHERFEPPIGWSETIWEHIITKPYKERLIIAGALIVAEIDRLNLIESQNNK